MKRSLRSTTWLAAVAALALFSFTTARAQGQRPAAATSKAVAPVDLTGYWVSVISQDWRWRMVTPAKGDYAGVPITAAAKKVADAWDPANDEAAGASCKAYGAPAIMRTPTRLRVSWQDENTLKIETDNGTQTRLLHFGAWKPGAAPRSLQGDSIAEWHAPRSARGQNNGPRYGSLQVTTKNLLPGYLRKNGVPYSENTTLQEYFDTFTEPEGTSWLVVTSIITDPMYLTGPYATTNHFKKIPDMQGWDPTPCRADQPR